MLTRAPSSSSPARAAAVPHRDRAGRFPAHTAGSW